MPEKGCAPCVRMWERLAQSFMVRTAGLEPTLPEGKQILSLLRLPISPRPHAGCIPGRSGTTKQINVLVLSFLCEWAHQQNGVQGESNGDDRSSSSEATYRPPVFHLHGHRALGDHVHRFRANLLPAFLFRGRHRAGILGRGGADAAPFASTPSFSQPGCCSSSPRRALSPPTSSICIAGYEVLTAFLAPVLVVVGLMTAIEAGRHRSSPPGWDDRACFLLIAGSTGSPNRPPCGHVIAFLGSCYAGLSVALFEASDRNAERCGAR